MKKIIFLTIVLTICGVSISAQEYYNTADKITLAPAKKIKQQAFHIKQTKNGHIAGKLVNSFDFRLALPWDINAEYEFDEQNRLISSTWFDKEDVEITKYVYDVNGNIIMTQSFTQNKKGKIDSFYTTVATFSEDTVRYYSTRLPEVNSSISTLKSIEIFDDGLKQTEQSFDGEMECDYIRYKYDENRNCVKEEYVYPTKTLEWNTRYKYNEHGVVIEKETQQGEAMTWNYYTYYDNGLLKSHRFYDIYRKQSFEYSYKYDFDEHGNWVSATVELNNIPQIIYKRSIEYW